MMTAPDASSGLACLATIGATAAAYSVVPGNGEAMTAATNARGGAYLC